MVFAALLPVFLGYRAVQDHLHLTRSFAEIESFSADITGLLSATPIMALWRVPSLAANGEAEIYLGIFAPLPLLAALVLQRPSDRAGSSPLAAACARAVAIIGVIYALHRGRHADRILEHRLGPLTLSASQTVQPFSIAVFCLILVGVLSPHVRRGVPPPIHLRVLH